MALSHDGPIGGGAKKRIRRRSSIAFHTVRTVAPKNCDNNKMKYSCDHERKD